MDDRDIEAEINRLVEDEHRLERAHVGLPRRPEEEDYFVPKPRHSGFFSTTLETLLRYLGSRTLIITGIAGNSCVLFAANDAYMRDYHLMIPSDCTVSNTAEENREALVLMRKFLKADTRPPRDCDCRGREGKSANGRRPDRLARACAGNYRVA